MTRVNLMLPLIQLNVNTNNAQIVTDALQLTYPSMNISNIFWVDSGLRDQQGKQQYECVVRASDISVNLNQVIDAMSKVQKYESTINRLKGDLFNMVNEYDLILSEKNNYIAKIQKYREDAKDSIEEASVSLKVEQKLKKTIIGTEQLDSSQRQFTNAISELTRQNLKLKDKLSYCQAHIQFLLKGGQQKQGQKKEYNK